jgi:hypothetical protein
VSIAVSLSLLFGIVLGLRFSVRAVFALCLTVMVAGIAAALSGFVATGEAALFAVSVTVALQVGYFVSMVIGAMNLTDAPEPSPAARPEARERFEMPRM